MKIGVWGDSIVYGACDSEGLGWVGRLRKDISEKAESNRLYNFGIGGASTKEALVFFGQEAKVIRPNHIMFALGVNDSKRLVKIGGNVTPPEVFEGNLQKLISQARTYTESITLIGLTRAQEEGVFFDQVAFENEQIEIYDSSVKKVAKEESVQYINVSNVLDIKKDLVDGIHPNTQGYQKLYEKIKSELDFI